MDKDFVTGSALGDIDMELHDIAQYLLKAFGDKREVWSIEPPWANPDDGLIRTQDPNELLRRSKYVKDIAMRVAGFTPLQWGLS